MSVEQLVEYSVIFFGCSFTYNACSFRIAVMFLKNHIQPCFRLRVRVDIYVDPLTPMHVVQQPSDDYSVFERNSRQRVGVITEVRLTQRENCVLCSDELVHDCAYRSVAINN